MNRIKELKTLLEKKGFDEAVEIIQIEKEKIESAKTKTFEEEEENRIYFHELRLELFYQEVIKEHPKKVINAIKEMVKADCINLETELNSICIKYNLSRISLLDAIKAAKHIYLNDKDRIEDLVFLLEKQIEKTKYFNAELLHIIINKQEIAREIFGDGNNTHHINEVLKTHDLSYQDAIDILNFKGVDEGFSPNTINEWKPTVIKYLQDSINRYTIEDLKPSDTPSAIFFSMCPEFEKEFKGAIRGTQKRRWEIVSKELKIKTDTCKTYYKRWKNRNK